MPNWNIELSRRLFLQAALAGTGVGLLGPLGCRPSTREPIARAKGFKRLAVVYLYGGNDGLNTIVPTTLDNYATRRGPLALPKKSLLEMGSGPIKLGGYAMHPSLSRLAGMWADGDVAIISKVGYPNPNGSHFVSQEIWSHGIRGKFGPLNIPESGWVARYADQFAPTPTGAISLGEQVPMDMLGGETSRFHAQSLDSFNLMPSYAERHLGSMKGSAPDLEDPQRLQRAMQVMDSSDRSGLKRDVRHAMAGATEMLDVVEQALTGFRSSARYGEAAPSTSLKDIATLCQAGFDTRIYFTGFGDFDHHDSQPDRHAEVLAQLDQGLGAFADDMKAMGIWDDMVVAVVSEFGRRNYANGSIGTDHGEGNFSFLLGGGVKGGFYGTDLDPADLEAESLPVEIDFRSIYREILRVHLDADPTKVFPEPQADQTVLGLFEV